MWNTFNVVQEHIVRGGDPATTSNGRRQRTRAIQGIDQNVKINKILWTLAEKVTALVNK